MRMASMRAMVLSKLGPIEESPLKMTQIEKHEIKDPDEILLKIEACGVCRSQLHGIEGDWKDHGIPPGLPTVPGHEIVGSVMEVGEKVTKFKIFIENKMYHNDCLSHTYRNKNATINAYLDDHACYAVALLDVFENSPDVKYLERARKECDIMLENFWDGEGGFYMVSKECDDLIFRPKNNYDLSLPSGNSVASCAMYRLYCITHEGKISLCIKRSNAFTGSGSS